MSAWRRPDPRIGAWLLAGLALVIGWDLTGLDLPVSRLFAGPQGFALRDVWFTRDVLHQGGRLVAGVLALLLALDAWRPWRPGPSRAARAFWLGLLLAGWLLVPAFKRLSLTSCPWELTEFGGVAQWVSHWSWGVRDGGPGRCFPSGHATTGFGFFATAFLWRRHAAGRWILAAVLVFGLATSWGQVARGAHYVSHCLWSAWACAVLCWLATAFEPVASLSSARASSNRSP